MGGMLTELDHGVGRVVDALKATGMYANSVVTFACDNGGALLFVCQTTSRYMYLYRYASTRSIAFSMLPPNYN